MLKYFLSSFSLLIVASSFANCDTINFSGNISGGRSISECVNGINTTTKNANSTMYITTTGLVQKLGYSAEEHVVQTEDGYILTIHRMPGKAGAPVVFLQHGLLSSSYDWVVLGKEKALAFKLADAGYDVWLGNFRGNTYSRCHATYETSDYDFWNFSWDEIGIYDLPAMISYVTNTTNQKIIYVGHSMGTTSFFVMAIEKPDIAEKVKVMMALAPVAYMDHATTPFHIIAPIVDKIEWFAKTIKVGEILSQSATFKKIIQYGCNLLTVTKELCTKLAFSTTGFEPREFNITLEPDIFYHTPAGSSLKSMLHYLQEFNSKKFERYDHGKDDNKKLYNSTTPPEYNISKIAVPIGIFWSENDWFANITDVSRFYEQLPNLILNHRVEYANFQHVDFMWGVDAPTYVYAKLLDAITKYR